MLKSLTCQRLRGRGLSRAVAARWLALWVIGAALALIPQSAPSLAAAAGGTALNAFIDMTCFPKEVIFPIPPGIGGPPPCDTSGIPVYSSPNPSGRAHLTVINDDAVHVDIKLQGIAPGQTVTAWFIWYFQFLYPFDEALNFLPDVFLSNPANPLVGVPEDIVSALPFPDTVWVPFAVAAHSVPLARTDAGYTEGLGPEPNQIFINQAGNGGLTVKLDYNPLKPDQGPLRNGLANTHQGAAPTGSDAFQPPCCPGLSTRSGQPVHQPVGSSFLRKFKADGFQKLDANGRPKLVRSPVPAVFISIISSLDKHTKGINPGLPHVPELGISGDHVIVGVFDLRDFHQ